MTRLLWYTLSIAAALWAIPGPPLGAISPTAAAPPAAEPAPASASAGGEPPAASPLARLGSRGVRLHDPSAVVKCKDEYWLFSTGAGVASYRSKDLRLWERGPRVFEQPPKWVRDAVPGNRNGNDFWAPEVIQFGGRYLLYYSVSSWGSNTSAIALATNRSLDPDDPAYHWADEGIVIRSSRRDDFNAIDPAPSLDADGKLWLAFGSFWSGIKLIQLDPATGKRIAPDSPMHSLAYDDQIEGPFLYPHGGHYYLFVAWGWCCRGIRSTYNIRVGRSDRITGPYLDKDGKDLRHGGGTLLLGTTDPFIGPGQPGVFADGDRYWLTCHFYDATQRGRGTLALRPLTWGEDGWPAVQAEDPAK